METFRDLQSFYRTTLSQSISASAGSIVVATAPVITTGYLVIEPNTANEEIVLMTNAVTTTLTITRGLAASGSSEAAGTGKAHPAGVSVIIADAHYYIKKLQVSKAFQFRGAFANITAINAITNPEAGDFAINLDNGFTYYYNGSTWVVTSGGSAPGDASTTTKGVAKMSTAPASASNPISVGDNDPRVPTQSENDALVGTSGTAVSSSNKLIDAADVDPAATANKIARRNATGDITVQTTPTANTDAASKIYVDNFSTIKTIASDTLKASADTERTITNPTNYALKKRIIVRYPGTIRTYFELKKGDGTPAGRIYINGVAVGTERSNGTTSYVAYTEDFVVGAGDSVELWTKGLTSTTDYVRNFRISYDITNTTIDLIIND